MLKIAVSHIYCDEKDCDAIACTKLIITGKLGQSVGLYCAVHAEKYVAVAEECNEREVARTTS
jgi:hypothetical protein